MTGPIIFGFSTCWCSKINNMLKTRITPPQSFTPVMHQLQRFSTLTPHIITTIEVAFMDDGEVGIIEVVVVEAVTKIENIIEGNKNSLT